MVAKTIFFFNSKPYNFQLSLGLRNLLHFIVRFLSNAHEIPEQEGSRVCPHVSYLDTNIFRLQRDRMKMKGNGRAESVYQSAYTVTASSTAL